LAFLGAFFAARPCALAQRALPADLKNAADVTARVGEIKTFVAAQVANLKNDKDVKAQELARNALIREASATASQAFLEAYAAALNQEIQPLAKSPLPRTRLQAAVTLARVANVAKSGQLADAISPFVTDESIAVSIWGMRAAGPTLAPLAKAGKQSKLPAAIVESVKLHPTSGDLIDEAYRALSLGNQVNPASAAVVGAEMLRLFQFRVDLYVKTTPPRPEADRSAVNFLSLESLWTSPTGKQLQPQIVQAFVNFAGLAAQHTGARPETDRRAFMDKLKGVGSAFTQIGKRLGDPALSAAGDRLSSVKSNASENEFTDAASAVYDAVKTKFPNIKPFPTMDPGATAEPAEAEIVESTADDLTNKNAQTRPASTPPSSGPTAGTPSAGKPAPQPTTPGAAPKTGQHATTPAPARPATPPARAPAPAPGGAAPKPAGAK
jgi:hypothetical protein